MDLEVVSLRRSEPYFLIWDICSVLDMDWIRLQFAAQDPDSDSESASGSQKAKNIQKTEFILESDQFEQL
jgi:hypothetical protein